MDDVLYLVDYGLHVDFDPGDDDGEDQSWRGRRRRFRRRGGRD
jgi:hypothetical protein